LCWSFWPPRHDNGADAENANHLLESLSKLVVEQGVDDGIESRVDVAHPGGQDEQGHRGLREGGVGKGVLYF
jgi:hypothetical protein